MNTAKELKNVADTLNLEIISKNPYPGRGMVLGLDDEGENLIQVYFVTGRGDDTRNRVLTPEKERVFTEAADPKKMKNPSALIFYNAMDETNRTFIVSNGIQTDTIKKRVAESGERGFELALYEHRYEPDPPICTSRIAGMCSYSDGRWAIKMASIRKSQWNDSCEYHFFHYPGSFKKGVGLYIATYSNDGNPPPTFRSGPLWVPLCGDRENIAKDFWNALEGPNRVALAVKSINLSFMKSEITIKKQYQKV
jgi:hypothetical protein